MPSMHLLSPSAMASPAQEARGPVASLLSVLGQAACLSAVCPDWATFLLHPLDEGSADFFCKGTGNKCVRL